MAKQGADGKAKAALPVWTSLSARGERGPGPAALALGLFDGVHRGHAALLRRCVALARQDNLAAVAVTFSPHPAKLLRPQAAPPSIEPLRVRLQRFADLGLDAAVVLPFDAALAAMPAEDFVHAILADSLQARHVVVGYDFCFGQRAQGNEQLLRRLGEAGAGKHAQTFVTYAQDAVTLHGVPASSSVLRSKIAAGDLAAAEQILGRRFCLYGRVEHGLQRGRTLGFPTANLRCEAELVPAYGVYAAFATGAFGRQLAAVSIGVHPTFEAAVHTKVEAYLLDYRGPPFYDTPMQLELVQRLRGEQKFTDAQALVAQMHTDCAQARRYLGFAGPQA